MFYLRLSRSLSCQILHGQICIVGQNKATLLQIVTVNGDIAADPIRKTHDRYIYISF